MIKSIRQLDFTPKGDIFPSPRDWRDVFIYFLLVDRFDGGGDHDSHVRECMFGGGWGAFDTKRHHFFNPTHPIYQNIPQIPVIRQRKPHVPWVSTTLRT